MVYFNYFIKCIIRKFVNFLFKPKILLSFLVVISLLFILQITSRAEWTDTQIQQTIEDLESIASMTYNSYKELEQIKTNVDGLPTRLEWINQELITIRDNISILANTTNNIYTEISSITSQLTTLNTEILNIYNSLEENQKELLTELKSENNAVLEELSLIREAIVGTEDKEINITDLGVSQVNFNGTVLPGVRRYYIPMKTGYTYNITVTFTNSYSESVVYCNYFFYDENIIDSDYLISSTKYYLGLVEPGNTKEFSFTYTDIKKPYLYFYYGNSIDSISVTASIPGISSSLNTNNQLQQDSNQLQQEQNDFLKDDNVVVDSSTLPSDTTEDITGNGFDNIFQQFYDTFTTGSAQDVVITIPFTNKSFTINANTVYGGANLGFIRTLIEAFWYFVISYFIVKDIGKKINKIKSGDIEHVQEDNIKEDLL